MNWYQHEIQVGPFPRGFHLITQEITNSIPELKTIKIGQLQVFVKHTSASLTINENADGAVAQDMEAHFNEMVPENQPYYEHIYEGPDDMPAHIKSSLLGSSVNIPIRDGRLCMGIWQGIFLCEHRNRATPRKLVLTAFGTS